MIRLFLAALVGYFGGSLLESLSHGLSVRRRRPEGDESRRKLDAKKLNEHIKLYGSFANTVGAATIGAAFIVPYIGNHTLPERDTLWWVIAGLALPLSGHIALRFMRSEG